MPDKLTLKYAIIGFAIGLVIGVSTYFAGLYLVHRVAEAAN
jgi:hypothetical protein